LMPPEPADGSGSPSPDAPQPNATNNGRRKCALMGLILGSCVRPVESNCWCPAQQLPGALGTRQDSLLPSEAPRSRLLLVHPHLVPQSWISQEPQREVSEPPGSPSLEERRASRHSTPTPAAQLAESPPGFLRRGEETKQPDSSRPRRQISVPPPESRAPPQLRHFRGPQHSTLFACPPPGLLLR